MDTYPDVCHGGQSACADSTRRVGAALEMGCRAKPTGVRDARCPAALLVAHVGSLISLIIVDVSPFNFVIVSVFIAIGTGVDALRGYHRRVRS